MFEKETKSQDCDNRTMIKDWQKYLTFGVWSDLSGADQMDSAKRVQKQIKVKEKIFRLSKKNQKKKTGFLLLWLLLIKRSVFNH